MSNPKSNNRQNPNSNSKPNHSAYNNPIFDDIDEEAEKQNKFVKLKDGESKILQFYPTRIEKVGVDFAGDGKLTTRINYIVTDPSDKNQGEKVISFAITNARRINNFLRRGNSLLEIIRTGSDRNTKYDFIPA